MAKQKVSELSGGLLDAAVAKIAGAEYQVYNGTCFVTTTQQALKQWWAEGVALGLPAGFAGPLCAFSPSSDWAHGGLLIERERIAVWHTDSGWAANMPGDVEYPGDQHYIDATFMTVGASTALEAAMRAFVAAKLGEEVELPLL